MDNVVFYLKKMLSDDLVYYNEFKQVILNMKETQNYLFEDILSKVLSSSIEIGYAKLVETKDYVKFIAWKGTISEKVNRALCEIDKCSEFDKPFCFWLCLDQNVDEYEK